MGRSATVCALVLLGLIASASADWKVGVAISNLASGGEVQFLTFTTKGLIIKKGLTPWKDCDGDVCSRPPATAQAFTLGAGFPTGGFTLKVQGKFVSLNAAGAVVLMSPTPARPATLWTLDIYNRIKSGSTCLDVPVAPSNKLAVSGAKVIASPCSNIPTQQWVFQPSENPPPVVDAHLLSLDIKNPVPMCLEAYPQQIGTPSNWKLVIDPLWKPCDRNEPLQKVTILADKNPALGTYNTGFFYISFTAAALNTTKCLMAIAPFNNPDVQDEANYGRGGVILNLLDCVNGQDKEDEDGSGYYKQFIYNSRGQLQNAIQVQGTWVNPDTGIVNNLPNCLSRDDSAANAPINLNIRNNVTLANCSLRRFINRWNFLTSDRLNLI